MDLEGAAWMVRNLGQCISTVHVYSTGVLAGGWDGRLMHWNIDGDHIWTAETGDRIQSIIISGTNCYITSGLAVVALDEGVEVWRTNLEGSADELALVNDELIATSSVYDIEHEDFMESAIWRLSLTGEILDCIKIDEKPWYFHADKGGTTLGIGRPRGGALNISKEEITHIPLGDSPVTTGINGRKSSLLGTADGSVWSSCGENRGNHTISIEHIICTEQGYSVALEGGEVLNCDAKGNTIDSERGDPVVCLHDWNGPWIGRWNGFSGSINYANDSWNCPRPRSFSSFENKLGIGLEDGMIILLDWDLFERRKGDKTKEKDSKKSALQAKLRALRS